MQSLISSRETAIQLNVTEETLAHWRSNSIGPDYIKFDSGTVRYRTEDIEKWCLENHTSNKPNILVRKNND